MKFLSEIRLNQFQLSILLDDEQMRGYKFMLEEGVYCSHCRGAAQKGIVVEEIYLTDMNNIMVRGICNICHGKVARIMDFGEDNAFYEKANDFRKAIRS